MNRKDFEREYCNSFENIPNSYCPKCKKENPPLKYDYDIEKFHPLNRNITNINEMHRTEFIRCGFCGRILFADGKFVGQ